MNYIGVNNARVYFYPVEDMFEKVKMTSSYLVGGAYANNAEAVDNFRISNGENDLFESLLHQIVHDVFWHLSVIAKDIANAVKITDVNINTPIEVPVTPPEMSAQPPPVPSMVKRSIVYAVSLPVNWSDNLIGSLDTSIESAIVYNSLMKLFKSRGQMDLFVLAREKYEGDTVMMKSIINYRNKPVSRKYRGF